MEMIKSILTAVCSTYVGAFVAFFSAVILWYYWHIHRPYANHPSYRVEFRLLNWILKKKHLNNVFFQELIKISKRYEAEGMFVTWIGLPYLFVYGEEIVKLILSDPAAINKPKTYEMFEFAIGKGLVTSNGEIWKKQRKLVNPGFHVNALKGHTSVMNKNADALVRELSEMQGQPTDNLTDILCKYSLRIICDSGFGINLYREGMEKISLRLSELIIYRLSCPWLYFDCLLPLFPSGREALKLVKEGRNVSTQIIEEGKKLLKAQRNPSNAVKSEKDSEIYGRIPSSFIEILLEEHMKDPSFSMRELGDQVNILVAAAFETTAHAVTWCLFLLGLHQDVQERVYDEVMAETDGDIRYTDFSRLTYLECVIKETLRIYPPVPIFGRCTSKDLQCGKYLIPKNSTVCVFTYMVHRNPEIYPEPEKFDPDRFMGDNSKFKSWHHIPFAEGNRSCIGKNFAMMVIKIILAHILRNFKVISLDRREDVEFVWAIVLHSERKLRMQFLPRH